MSILTGTNIIAPVIPGATGDSFATHIDIYGQGGYLAVSGINERDYINIDRRSPGMIVYTRNDGKFWSLKTGLSSWIELPLNGFYPRIVSQNILYTIDDQNLLSGIKSFKNYNDTKFYNTISAISGLCMNATTVDNKFTVISRKKYFRNSGRLIEETEGTDIPSLSGLKQIKTGIAKTGISGFLLEDVWVELEDVIKQYASRTGDAELEVNYETETPEIELQDKPTVDVIIDGNSGRPDGGDAEEEQEEEEEDEEEEEGEEESLDEEDNDPLNDEGGPGVGLGRDDDVGGGPNRGGPGLDDGGGGEGGTGGVKMIFINSSTIFKVENSYSKIIYNINAFEKGKSFSSGLNLAWGPNPAQLYPGEQYIAQSQIISGIGFTGGVTNDSRTYRTSGLYDNTGDMIWNLTFSGRIGGYLPILDIEPWTGSVDTFAYAISKRYWGVSSKESLTGDEITGLLSGEYNFDPRQTLSSSKTFIPKSGYIYFAWPADSGFNNIDFWKTYKIFNSKSKLNIPPKIQEGYRFIIDKKEVHFNESLVPVKNSVNYTENYYVFRNRWILNGSDPIKVSVRRVDERII